MELTICCTRFLELIKEEDLLCVMETKPFSSVPIPPQVYMLSDGGHGGMEPIYYCPLCGVKILFLEEEEETVENGN